MKLSHIILSIFALLVFASCDNEDVDDLNQTTTADLIAEESNLFDLLDQVVKDDPNEVDITCIDFIYSFIVIVYNEDLQIISSQTVSNDGEFSTILSNIEANQFINVSFPITSELEDGTTFQVNNKEELEAAILACKAEEEEELINECTGLFLECVWEVALPDDVAFSTYTNAVFDNEDDGTTDLYYRGVSYNGTWTVYLIEGELHININLQGEGDVQSAWNFDWKTVIQSNDTMTITNDEGVSFVLNKECDEANYCKTLDFESCIIDGESSFTLSDYDDCVIIIAAPQQEVDEVTGEVSPLVEWGITYYDSQSDADAAINILADQYIISATAGTQVVYARIENPETLEYTVATINLIPEDCE
ncbi:MAG: hypothetical protein ACJAZZ_000613 [Dokdonia donghaensis]|jgi:hypothetical protein